ncbi:MAG: peptide-methionine (S)-S-oxide reductase MsrA [Candidatus Woesearchaeota archaeon]
MAQGSRATAMFAGGCFWCIEHAFTKVEGVLSAIPGYTGGETSDPTYNQVAQGTTGHREAVLVTYDPTIVSYDELLEIFWRSIDPTDDGGQFADRGSQYTTAIFTGTEEEKQKAEESKRRLEASNRFSKPIVTEILLAGRFWIAENEHHDYANTHPLQYRAYAIASGREVYCKRMWKE